MTEESKIYCKEKEKSEEEIGGYDSDEVTIMYESEHDSASEQEPDSEESGDENQKHANKYVGKDNDMGKNTLCTQASKDVAS